MIRAPTTENELMQHATNIAGKTLQHIANINQIAIPEKLTTAKGWVGELIESSLGASAGHLPEPDFQLIGVELKTLPLNAKMQPKESTYVCVVSLEKNDEKNWETSLVKKKLSRVLWVPVEADPDIPLAQRRVGSAFLWSPSPSQNNILRNDWQEMTDMIVMGKLDQITAEHGQYLQIRPKAADSKSLGSGNNEEGDKILTLPRGFYLRASFTRRLLQNSGLCAGV